MCLILEERYIHVKTFNFISTLRLLTFAPGFETSPKGFLA